VRTYRTVSISLSPEAFFELGDEAIRRGLGGSALATRIVLSDLALRRECAERGGDPPGDPAAGGSGAPAAEIEASGVLEVDRGWCWLWIEVRGGDGRIRRTREAVHLALATRIRDGAGSGSGTGTGTGMETSEVWIGGEWICAIGKRADLVEACRRARGA
jgi:hypothetical protein